jgi:hypothetical protein
MKLKSKLEADVYRNSLKGSRAKYESLSIPYLKVHIYKPDFVLPNGIIVEVKGRFTSLDRAKHKLVKKHHPELDIRFVFGWNNKLNKSSLTRYSDWCDQHGFKYAIVATYNKKILASVPQAWLKEPKKEIKIERLQA